MFEIDAEINESSAFKKDLWKNQKQRTIKQSIFEFYYQLYHNKTDEEISILRQKVEKAIEDLIWCFQMMSLLWAPSLPIKDWVDHMTLWEIIGYSRLDNICSEIGIIDVYLYLSIVVNFTIFLSIMTSILIIYRFASLPALVFILFKWIFSFWLNLIFIPSMTLYSIFLKYSFNPSRNVSEYKNNNNPSNFEVNAALQISIIFSMIIAFLLILFHTEFSGEIKHALSTNKLKSKAHSKLDIHIAILSYFSPIFYVLFDKEYIIYYQCLLMIILIILITETIIFLPYFSSYCNLALILRLFTVSVVSFGFILGYWMDNSVLIILIAILLGPIAAVFIYQFTQKCQRCLIVDLPKGLDGINSVYKLEKSLRNSLLLEDSENKDQIIYLFEIFFIEKYLCRDKFQILWVTNYCLFTLQDEPLSKIKLRQAKNIPGNLESDFQEYLCYKHIESLRSESTKYIDYFQQLHIIKKKDLKLCVNLLKFWEELITSKPDIKKLSKELLWIEEKLLFLNNKYIEFTARYFDSKESLDLYASYAKDILFDWEKSNLLKNKSRSFGRSTINSYSRNFEFFNDHNGIFIISCEEGNFGEILFSNPKSSEIMKCHSYNINGASITNFIPTYYCEKLYEEIHRTIHFASCSEIDLNERFFLILPSHFLIECSGKILITSHDNCLISILIFKPKIAKHQVALISETGEICSYSENFSKFTKNYRSNLAGYNLKNLFPEIPDFAWQWFIPYRLSGFETETILVLCYYHVNKMKVFYAVITNESDEIQRWKNKNSLFEKENEGEKFYLASQISLNVPNTERNSVIYNEDSEIKEISVHSEMNLNKSSETAELTYRSEEKSQISEYTYHRTFIHQITTSSRSINILHLSITLAIIAVLGANIAVLLYAFSNINFIRNMDLPLTLGRLGKKLQNVAYTPHLLWALSPGASSDTQQVLKVVWNKIITYNADLKDMYLNITSNLEEWNYCSGKEIFMGKNIKLWNSNKKINLLDMISEFIQTVKNIQGNEFVRKYNNSEDYNAEASFLIANGYGEAFEYCNNSLYEVLDCQKVIMSDFKSKMFIFLILGIGVLAFCFFFMIPFWYSTVKIESDLWNNLRKKAYEHHFELKESLVERLKRVHSQPDILLSNETPSKKYFNFRNYWKYIWRFVLYFIVVSMFSIINITYLYEKCTNYLFYRPEILKEIIRGQILQNSIAIWATNSQFEHWGIPLINNLPNNYPLMNSWSAFQNDLAKLERSKLVLRDPKYSPILSEIFKKSFFEYENESNHYYFDYGAYAAEDIIKFDSYWITYSNMLAEFWLIWALNIEILTINYGDLADEIDSYSQGVIDDQVTVIGAAFAVFAICSIIIYFSLYFIFFRKEKQYLQKINSMLKIIPWQIW